MRLKLSSLTHGRFGTKMQLSRMCWEQHGQGMLRTWCPCCGTNLPHICHGVTRLDPSGQTALSFGREITDKCLFLAAPELPGQRKEGSPSQTSQADCGFLAGRVPFSLSFLIAKQNYQLTELTQQSSWFLQPYGTVLGAAAADSAARSLTHSTPKFPGWVLKLNTHQTPIPNAIR